MQLAFFLLPKSETLYLTEQQTLRQAMEKMQFHGLGAVVILNGLGQYVGTITTADFLWYLKDNHQLNLTAAEKVLIQDIPRRHDNVPVTINTEIRNLFRLAMKENFIPVVDDLGVFIGIVRRREIMEFFQQKRRSLAAEKLSEPDAFLLDADDWLTGAEQA